MERYKKGDINPTTGMIFWSYSHRVNGKEGWLTKEAFERKNTKQKEAQKSESSKSYFKEYYNRNKEFYKEQRKGYREQSIEESPLKLLFFNTRSRSVKRKQSFEITFDFINQLWNKQEGKCYYTGLEMDCSYGNKTPYQVSIDRINSLEGYTEENTVLCCLSINFAKNCFNEQQLKEFLEKLKN